MMYENRNYLDMFEIFEEFFSYREVFCVHIILLDRIVLSEESPVFFEFFESEILGSDRKMLDTEHSDEVICLGTIGDREMWDLMDTGEDAGMESHTDHCIE